MQTFNRSISSLCILCAILMFACHETADREVKKEELVLHRSIGERISADLANKWIANYEKVTSSGRLQDAELIVTNDQLAEILAQFPALGLGFNYAINDEGEIHIIALAVDEERRFWSGTNVRRGLDVTTNTFIDEATARSWTRRFKDANPNAVWFHFFGLDVFADMNTISWFKEFEVVFGLNDENIKQLMLIVGDGNTRSGRILTDGPVYDKSTPCPSFCNSDE